MSPVANQPSSVTSGRPASRRRSTSSRSRRRAPRARPSSCRPRARGPRRRGRGSRRTAPACPASRGRRTARPAAAPLARRELGDGAERRHLRHPPRVRDVEAVPLLEALDHRPRRGRAADDHRPQPREVPAAGFASRACRIPIQIVGTPAVTVTSSCTNASSRLGGSRCGPGKTCFGADQRAREREAPRVRVEHRHDRQHVSCSRSAERAACVEASEWIAIARCE